jgi:hypothetical protein
MITTSAAGAGKSVIWYGVLSKVRFRELMLLASSAIIEDIRTYAENWAGITRFLLL